MVSVRSHILNAVIRVGGKRRLAKLEFTPAAITATRARLDRLGERNDLTPELTRELGSLGDVATEWTRPSSPARGVIFYCHGGAYAVGSPKLYRGLAARFAARTQCDVAVIDYRLAPEHPYPAAPDDAIRAYEALLTRVSPNSVVVAGDSAGGNLAMVTLLRARARGLPMPAAAVLLSPWTDLTGSGASMQINRKRDPMLPAHRIDNAARLYASAANLADPDVSPCSPIFPACRRSPSTSVRPKSCSTIRSASRRVHAITASTWR